MLGNSFKSFKFLNQTDPEFVVYRDMTLFQIANVEIKLSEDAK